MSDVLSDALKGEALGNMKQGSGYQVLLNDIIFPMYQDAWVALEAGENPEARAMLKALKDIVAKIDDTVNLGRQAREEYNQQLQKSIGGTP